MIAVAAFMTTMNFFASADTSAAARALGVSTNPARTSTLSRTTSSCAWRLATSGATPPVSLRMISSFFPATVSPCSFTYSLMALSICVAPSANCREQGVGKSGAHFRVKAVENPGRRARGREQAEPASVVLEARHAGLGRRGDVGHLRVALRVGVGERAQPARLELLQNRRRSREHHLRFARDRRRHRGAGALVGDVQQVDPGAVVEQLAREVRSVADTGRAEGKLGVGPRREA